MPKKLFLKGALKGVLEECLIKWLRPYSELTVCEKKNFLKNLSQIGQLIGEYRLNPQNAYLE